MKKVMIVGTGMGRDTLTQEGLHAVEKADLLMGAEKILLPFREPGKKIRIGYTFGEVQSALNENSIETIAVLVSGDTGFYSAARKLQENLAGCEIETLPGISSLSYFFAKRQKPWQDVFLLSRHGREGNLVDTVRRNQDTFLLTDDSLADDMRLLIDAGYGDLKVSVGENLGTKEERILSGRVRDFENPGTGMSRVMEIENPDADPRIRSGIPDEEFARGDVPMTKSEVRAVDLSLLHLNPGETACDIGAGTGSVTVEMALAAYKGRVYAVERLQEGADLIRKNAARFHLGNVAVFRGNAAEVLLKLPKMDAAFIGGSGGELSIILKTLFQNNPDIRIVINAVTPETVAESVSALSGEGKKFTVTEIGSTRSRMAGTRHLMQANNPVFIISAGGEKTCTEGS